MDSPRSSVSLAVLVQHHPARAHLLPALTAALGECQVVTDPEPDGRPSPIRCYLACLHAFCMQKEATHGLVVQDDAVPCMQFACKTHSAIAARPDSLVALFLGGAPARSARMAKLAHNRGEAWIQMAPQDWTPTVALVWPRGIAERFLAYAEENPALIRVGDDNAVGAFTTAEGLDVWACVPSLIEHPDVEASLIGRKAGAGKNRFRVAAVPPVM